jgi:hypothetical protein
MNPAGKVRCSFLHQREKKLCRESNIAHSRTEFQDSVCLSPTEALPTGGRWLRDTSALPPEGPRRAMPITRFLERENLDAETRRILGVAFEAARVALRTDSDAYINEAIAKKMIDFAKAGERSPDLLCERVLNVIRMHM